MKKMVLTDLNQMKMIEVDIPEIKNNNDILLKMKRIGVCGSDIHYYTTGRIGDQIVEFPFAVGHEGSGEVVSVGNDVKNLKVGDRVAIDPAMPCWECDQCKEGRSHTCRNLKFLGCPGQAEGCLSEYIIMPESSCIKINEKLTYDHAALSEPLSIGIYAVKQSQLDSTKSIGILGFGPIGMSVFFATKNKNVDNIYVTEKIEERIKMANKAGAVLTSNPDNEDVVEKIHADNPTDLDIVFECCGQQDALENAIDLLKPGGTLMLVGIPEFDYWQMDASKLRRKEISIINVRRQNECVEEALDMIASGKVDIDIMTTHRYNFDDSKEAFDLVAGYKDGVMKAMIDFD
jgi:L-iditol 2-dehydrogenase